MWGKKIPEFEKPVAINTRFNDEFISPYNKNTRNKKFGSIKTLKSRIVNYILADCNSGAKIINKNNIDLLIDNDTKQILIRGIGNGKMCLNNINTSIIQNIIIQENEDYDVSLDL